MTGKAGRGGGISNRGNPFEDLRGVFALHRKASRWDGIADVRSLGGAVSAECPRPVERQRGCAAAIPRPDGLSAATLFFQMIKCSVKLKIEKSYVFFLAAKLPVREASYRRST